MESPSDLSVAKTDSEIRIKNFASVLHIQTTSLDLHITLYFNN